MRALPAPNRFRVFVSAAQIQEALQILASAPCPRIEILPHGDPIWESSLEKASGLIGTVGHSLASEAMHLAIPHLALPYPVYEQALSAKVISDSAFGIMWPKLDAQKLTEFIQRAPEFRANIFADTKTLMSSDGLAPALSRIHSFLA